MNVISSSPDLFSENLGFNATLFPLDGTSSSLLNWEIPESLPPTLWDLNLGIEELKRSLTDPLYLATLELSVKQLISSTSEKETIGVVFYRGSADLAYRFPWNEESLDLYAQWRNLRYEDQRFPADFEAHLKRIFSLSLLSEFCLQLASHLPDMVDPFMLFDCSSLGTPAMQAHLLSPHRFPYMKIGVRGLRFSAPYYNWEVGKAYGGYIGRLPIPSFPSEEPSIAICLPEDSYCTPTVLSKVDEIYHLLNAPCRILPEALLTECWDGVDDLYIIEESMSERGRRKLLGFSAAGGKIHSCSLTGQLDISKVWTANP